MPEDKDQEGQPEAKENFVTVKIAPNGNFEVKHSFEHAGRVIFELQRVVVWMCNRINGEEYQKPIIKKFGPLDIPGSGESN